MEGSEGREESGLTILKSPGRRERSSSGAPKVPSGLGMAWRAICQMRRQA